MSKLFQVLRVDHLLGFFPSAPMTTDELCQWCHANLDPDGKPYAGWHLLVRQFGGDAKAVSHRGFDSRGWDVGDDWYDFKPEVDNA
jgi:hypothetical protein